ncbi:MAG: tetratricopeptide repeat protein [Lewinellaceae bacterium]|nr:tetratricopeptide repeat protein [Lewinellaceae bacterium]
MTKLQIGVLTLAAGLFFLLYFTCDTKPPSQHAIEKSRAITIESTDISSLLAAAKSRLAAADLGDILTLESALKEAGDDSLRIEANKALSSRWYELGEAAVAGYYAEEVANLEESAPAWGIAGTTYMLCTQQAKADKDRQFCASRALNAFESAVSLDPEELSYRLNLALVYTDFPPSDNPMKGILMLRELDTQNPDNPSVLFQLGRLAIRTGQWDRAIQRLDRVVELNPDNRNAWCLLEQANRETGNTQRADFCLNRCQENN